MALMLIEVDQLSTKINLQNRQSAQRQRQSVYEQRDEKYDEELVMLKMAKLVDALAPRFNAAHKQRSVVRSGSNANSASQGGSGVPTLADETSSQHTQTTLA